MGGTKRLGLHKGASQKKNTHTHTNILLNYNKQLHRGHYTKEQNTTSTVTYTHQNKLHSIKTITFTARRKAL